MALTLRYPLIVIGLLFGIVCNGCSRQPEASPTSPSLPAPTPAKVTFPPLGTGTQIEPGITFHELVLDRNGVPMKVWLYVPSKPAANRPCMLVGPAGTHLIDGMKLAKGDQAEHLPYARAGFVVVSFEIDGPWPEVGQPSNQQVIAAAKAFMNARAGLDNAQTALDFALERVPSIDPQRIYVAGHSSAATLALLVASSDKRIKACASFAPATDPENHVGAVSIRGLDFSIRGFANFMKASSPRSRLAELTCPVFLFSAKDDTVTRSSQVSEFATMLKKTNPHVTYVEVSNGGHYDSMIRQGIPQAIPWFQKLEN